MKQKRFTTLFLVGWNTNYNKVENTRNLVVYDYGSVMHYGKSAFAKRPFLPAMVVSYCKLEDIIIIVNLY